MPAAKKTTKSPSTLTEPAGKSGVDRDAFLMAVSAEVRKARERADMTVSDLHRETGISRTVLQGYEAGRFVPGGMELKKLCQVLKVTPNRILFGEESPLENKPLLASYIGDVSKATGTAKLAIALQVLSSEELAALLSLVESIVIGRVGGAKNLQKLLNAADLLIGDAETPGFIENMGEEFFNQLSDEQKKRLQIAAEDKFGDNPVKKKR
jgi:transcriptional regulator with XRE-family HTH domain